jgi:hypothetical protein
MAAEKVAIAPRLLLGRDGTGNDAFEQCARLGRERFGHRVRRLTDGDHEAAAVGVEIEQIFTHAEHAAAFEIDVAVEGSADAGIG